MSRILARSILADYVARAFVALLFLLLSPIIFILSRRIEKRSANRLPNSASRSAQRMTEAS